jgi:signal peptidase I
MRAKPVATPAVTPESVTGEAANRKAPRSSGPSVSTFTMALCAAVIVSVLATAGWMVSGGRLLDVTTPSMCPTVCVGSLVAVHPYSGPLAAGELVTFVPPGQTQMFTHRIAKILPNGSFTTKGDAESSPDPWIITRAEMVGKVNFALAGVGWWLRALPLVAVGTFLLLMVRRTVKARHRRSFERLFGAGIVTIALLVLKPLVRGQLVQATLDPHHQGWIKGLIVNEGLLPAQFHVVKGQVLHRLSPSKLHFVSGPRTDKGYMIIHQWASLPWWGWGIVLALVLSPMCGFLAYRLRTPLEADEIDDGEWVDTTVGPTPLRLLAPGDYHQDIEDEPAA